MRIKKKKKTAKNTGLLVLLKESLGWRTALGIILTGNAKGGSGFLLMEVPVDVIVYYVTF